jgi:hypothetical protein
MTDAPSIRATTAQSIANILLGLTLADRCHILSAVLGGQAALSIKQHGLDRADAEMMIEAIAKDAKAKMRAAAPLDNAPAPTQAPPPAISDGKWGWWSGTSEEVYTHGPFDTKDEALEAARQDASGEFQAEDGTWLVHVYFCEATNPPLRLADWIGADQLIERAEEEIADSDRTDYEFDEGPFFDVKPDQEKDLITRIEAACDDWQKDHGLIFTCRTFAAVRNNGDIALPHPNGD